MPIYTMLDEAGKVEEMHLSFSRYCEIYDTRDSDDWVEIDGKRWRHDIVADLTSTLSPTGDLWPLPSDSVGVDPSQVGEAMARDKKMGVPTSYTAEGDAIWRSEGHRTKYIKAMGYQDRRRYA